MPLTKEEPFRESSSRQLAHPSHNVLQVVHRNVEQGRITMCCLRPRKTNVKFFKTLSLLKRFTWVKESSVIRQKYCRSTFMWGWMMSNIGMIYDI